MSGLKMGSVSNIPSGITTFTKANAIKAMTEWFFQNFEDPANSTPYDQGYVYIWGGPYDAGDEIYAAFENTVPESYIEEAISIVEGTGMWEWAPHESRLEEDFDPLEVLKKFDELQRAVDTVSEELAVLKAAHKADIYTYGGIGHNRPPEPISDIPLEDGDLSEIGSCVAAIKNFDPYDSSQQKIAQQIQSFFTTNAHKILGYVAEKSGKHLNTFVDEFSKSAGKAAGGIVGAALGSALLAAAAAIGHWLFTLS